jgi:hypothetical protein
MSFALNVARRQERFEDGSFFIGSLQLGSEHERLACSSKVWSASQYKQQWIAAVSKLLHASKASSALVVSVERGRNNFEWWPMYRNGISVQFHNQWLQHAKPMRRIEPKTAHRAVTRLRPSTKYAKHGMSTWSVPVKALHRWLAAQKRAA